MVANANHVAFRVDASEQIGTGHFMRCLTLADGLRQHGARIRFVSRHLPEQARGMLAARGHEFVPLESAPDAALDELAHARWLGTSQTQDAKDAIQALSDETWDWLIVDHYALDARWESVLRPAARNILAIDDLADRRHLCDVLLDQNYESTERYEDLVAKNCRLLLGPRYALLRPEYAAFRKTMTSRNEVPRKVLVFFGGADHQNMTGLSLTALSQSGLRHLHVDVVVGAYYGYRDSLEEQAAGRPHTTIHEPRPHLADLMAKADLAIGAGGVTNWERMCLGLPSLVVTVAENQVPVSRLLDGEGAIRLVGDSAAISAADIRDALVDEIETRKYVQRAAVALTKCDGDGVSRVIRVMLSGE